MTVKDAYQYILGGKAEFTVLSESTGVEYTFKVVQKSILPGIWYVYHRRTYLGFIRGDLFIKEQEGKADIKTVNAFAYMWKRIVSNRLPDTYKLNHTGKCGYCGRKLKRTDSIEKGFGPDCLRKLTHV